MNVQTLLSQILLFVLLTLGGLGCISQPTPTATPIPTSIPAPSLTPTPISSPFPTPVSTLAPFAKPPLAKTAIPTYLFAFFHDKALPWIGFEPAVIGSDSTSATVYFATFSRKLSFVEGLLPKHSFDVDILTLYERHFFSGKEHHFYVPSQFIRKHKHTMVSIIEDEQLVGQVETSFKSINEIYYDPVSDLWYASGWDDNDDGMVVAYRHKQLLKQWSFPGKNPMQLVGDGRGYVYLSLHNYIDKKQGKIFVAENFWSIVVLHNSNQSYPLVENSRHRMYLYMDTTHQYVYNYFVSFIPDSGYTQPLDNQLWFIRDGKIVSKQPLPYGVDALSDVYDPSTKQFYSPTPKRINDLTVDSGIYPVFSFENEHIVFDEPINLKVEEPYPDDIQWALDQDTATLYGLDSPNRFVYVVREKNYIGRFPVNCDHPHHIHVNAVTSLIYISCNFEVQVFAYPELISPSLQAQIDHLKPIVPDLFKPFQP